MSEFYTGRYDRVFKTIICKEEDKRLLTLILEPSIEGKITNIEIKKCELPVNHIRERVKIVDLIVEVNNNSLLHVELNLEASKSVRFRNYVYFSHAISNKIKRSEKYDRNYKYMHIDFSYGMSENVDSLYKEYYLQTETQEKYVENVKVIEYNMDYIKSNWYDKPELKYLAMLDMKPAELEVLGKGDEVVMDYKSELEKLNKDEEFQAYMSEEEAYKMQYNTDISDALEEGMEKGIKQMIISMKAKGIELSDIAEIAKIDEEKVKSILNNAKEG